MRAARAAQSSWEQLPAIERAGHLRAISAKLRRHHTELADIIVREQGKIRGLAQVEVDFTADYIDYMAEWARRLEGEVLTSDRPKEMMLLLRKPIGVVAGILPWNFPFFLIARKMAPALVTGNAIVIKPSEETPINAFVFAELVAETDLPAGVFNLVGGKAPAIVLADADLDLAATAIHASRVINTGQVCNCAEQLYVEESVHDAFVAKLKALFEQTRWGDPSETDELDMGPLINRAASR